MYLILKANDLFPLYNMMEVNWVQQIFKKKLNELRQVLKYAQPGVTNSTF